MTACVPDLTLMSNLLRETSVQQESLEEDPSNLGRPSDGRLVSTRDTPMIGRYWPKNSLIGESQKHRSEKAITSRKLLAQLYLFIIYSKRNLPVAAGVLPSKENSFTENVHCSVCTQAHFSTVYRRVPTRGTFPDRNLCGCGLERGSAPQDSFDRLRKSSSGGGASLSRS